MNPPAPNKYLKVLRAGLQIKKHQWHFHQDPQEGILIHDLEKNNSRNTEPTI